jgi:hypothetical protein
MAFERLSHASVECALYIINRSMLTAPQETRPCQIGSSPDGHMHESGKAINCKLVRNLHVCMSADSAGFIRIDESLRAEGVENVFAVGDVANSVKHPRPKAGVYAVRQGPPLADNLRRRVPSLAATSIQSAVFSFGQSD